MFLLRLRAGRLRLTFTGQRFAENRLRFCGSITAGPTRSALLRPGIARAVRRPSIVHMLRRTRKSTGHEMRCTQVDTRHHLDRPPLVLGPVEGCQPIFRARCGRLKAKPFSTSFLSLALILASRMTVGKKHTRAFRNKPVTQIRRTAKNKKHSNSKRVDSVTVPLKAAFGATVMRRVSPSMPFLTLYIQGAAAAADFFKDETRSSRRYDEKHFCSNGGALLWRQLLWKRPRLPQQKNVGGRETKSSVSSCAHSLLGVPQTRNAAHAFLPPRQSANSPRQLYAFWL